MPTLDELLAAESTFDPADVSVTAILNHWSRTTICRQLDALRAQATEADIDDSESHPASA